MLAINRWGGSILFRRKWAIMTIAERKNVARSKTSRGEGLVPRSRQTGNQPWSQATVEKTRLPAPNPGLCAKMPMPSESQH